MDEEPIKFLSPTPSITAPKKKGFLKIFFKFALAVSLISGLVAMCAYWWFTATNAPNESFPVGEPVTIAAGMDVREIISLLAVTDVVRSESLLYYALVLLHEPTDIKASTYIFEEPLTTLEIAARLTEGDFDTDLIRFTHFEGERASQLAIRASKILPSFNQEKFVDIAEPLEGTLFPDTYFLPLSYTEEDLLLLLTNTFDEQISGFQMQISEHPLSLDEILVLASIIEREANAPASMKMVSGVLQNRLAINMALQADASIEYVLDKPLSELTPDDLKVDSPYNTYLNTGLPPTPIGNPGLDSIIAVLEPTVTDNFFYITDSDGIFHYAETYNGHLRNIELYLR